MSEDWKLPWAGGCRCGKLRYEVTAPPLLSIACHCAGCQSMTASAYSLSLAIPNGGFAVTAGEPVIGGLHGAVEHLFCDWCKTWVFTRPPGLPFVNLRPTTLDDHGWVVPFVEICTDEKLPWAATSAQHSYPKIPGPETFQSLLPTYAEQGARPG
jgi:hypothetical protein